MKFRIGIATHYSANNFGAVLQCKALSDAIVELAPNVECNILDFEKHNRTIPPSFSSVFRKKRGAGITGIIKGLIHGFLLLYTRIKAKHHTPTQDFINEEMTLDSRVHINEHGQLAWESEQIPYDALVCGSDQIWAHWCISPYFVLETMPRKAIAKLAYAPSFGDINKLQADDLRYLETNLKQFSAISCREQDGAELLNKMLGKPCPIVPDPTILHTRDYWLKLARKPRNFPHKEKGFVFTYHISFMQHARKMASYAAKQLGLPLVTCELVAPHSFYSQLGPREFLWCIANAAHVITPSFHGTVFSLIMGTPFHSISSSAPQERLKTPLRSVGLLNRLVNETCQVDTSTPFPSNNELEHRIEKLRTFGRNWLTSELQKAVTACN